MTDFKTRLAIRFVDYLMAVIPRPRPEQAALRRCQIVSHRGEHDGRDVRENTLRAYANARENGVWGIEADIRWTADLVPVILHDPDATRVFGKPARPADLTFAQLRRAVPEIPSLAELVAEFGGNTHLMLELKQEDFPDLPRQRQLLAGHLASLRPGQDYHLLALDLAVFDAFDNMEPHTFLPVSESNTAELSRISLGRNYGGFSGHYLLMNNERKRRHEQKGQLVGTGFIRSRNCLFREINRGVEWIFSNDAVKLQKIIKRTIDKG